MTPVKTLKRISSESEIKLSRPHIEHQQVCASKSLNATHHILAQFVIYLRLVIF